MTEAMSARKKPWVRSAFSSIDMPLQNDTPKKGIKKTRSNNDLSVTAQATSLDISLKQKNCSIKENSCKTPVVLSNENWMEFFTPTKIEDLAVHSKKVEELEDWFMQCEALHRTQPVHILLLTGPTGAGKTAAVKLLALQRKYQIQEWINPIDKEIVTQLGDQTGTYVGSQLEAFRSFLMRASRYKSLLSDCDKRLLLVEDFPNALLNDAVTFTGILDDYLSYGKAPVVFIVTDSKTKHLNISFNLFPDEVKMKYKIKHITLNPVATTLLNKALKRCCQLMGRESSIGDVYKVPPADVIDSIVFSSQGDIRNALINLHFASLKGAPCVAMKPQPEETTKSRSKKKSSLRSIGCDESLTMFHALGRVFNPKYNSNKELTHSPASLVELLATEPKNVLNIIHANYLMHFGDIESTVLAADGISISDILFKDYREESLGTTALHVAVGTAMVANTAPTSGWKPVRGPKRIIVEKPQQDTLQSYGLRSNLSKNLFSSEYRTYIKLIPKPTAS